jgi:hypothetical protein
MAGVLAYFFAGQSVALAQTPINPPGSSIALPNITKKDIKLPTIEVSKEAVVVIPPTTVPGVAVLITADQPKNVKLPKGENLLLVNLPGLSILVPNLAKLATFGNGALGIVLDQVGLVDQLFANTANANLLAPVNQVIDDLVSGGAVPSDGTQGVSSSATSILTLAASNLWTWNAATIGTTDHAGFKFQSNGGGDPVTGTTLPGHSVDRAELPGILWDASSHMGLPRGSVFFGATGGVSESDIDLKSDETLNKVKVADPGGVKLRSWSAGGFALLVTDAWYVGSTAGGSWGSAESENHLTGAESEYDLTSFTSSLFLGTIVPVTDTLRVDLRGTLAYQRAVADAHADTCGIAYGEHAIEAANASIAGRLFALMRAGDGLTLRPFIQAGVGKRFHYDNELDIGSVEFTFVDANSSVFAAGGIDFESGETLHLSASVRRDHSPDYDSLSGRFGLMVRLN